MSDEVRQEVRAKVLQYLAFGRLETNKFELKREWYKLRESKGRNEFLRDITVIINSYGGENAFIVFGIDEKSKELSDTKIEDSGYKDSASIKNLVDSTVDKPFRFDVNQVTINDKSLSFVYLHPSPDKPHVIIKYVDDKGRETENAIFIRSGSAKVSPTKGDLDRMYIERNSIIVERKADVAINFHGFQFSSKYDQVGASHLLHRQLLIENRGTRVLPIYKVYLQFDLGDEKVLFIHETEYSAPIIINPNGVYRGDLKFTCVQRSNGSGLSFKLNQLVNKILEDPRHGDVLCSLILGTGELLPTNLFMPNINHAKVAIRVSLI